MGIASFLLPGISAIAGGIKHYAYDRPREREAAQAAGETTRWSPFTGMNAQPVNRTANPFASILGMGLKGAELGMGIDKYLSSKDVKDLTKQISNKLIDKGLNPWENAAQKAFGGYDNFNVNKEYMGEQMPKLTMPKYGGY